MATSLQAESALVTDVDWVDKSTVERRETLVKSFKEVCDKLQKPYKAASDWDDLRKRYEAAVEQCVYDRDDEEQTLLHYLFRTIETHHIRDGSPQLKQFCALIQMSLLALFKRHGDKGLFDSLHLAIKRKHFQLLKYICEENETGEFKKLVTEGIAELKSSQNCLHAIIAIIATDPHYIDMVKTLVKCADTKAFATKRQADGNTPLHDFAMFTGKRFKIYESKSSKQRPSSFPDWVGDEKRYAEEYVTILRIMIQKCPSALWTLNNEGKTPYVVHRETRPLSINGERWDKLEYDATRLDGGSAVVIEEDQPQVSRVASNGFKNTEVENANPKKAVETAKLQRSNSLIPIPPKKEPQRAPREESSRSNGQEWVYSRYLAREIGKQLLDECCSLSSWDEARTGIFGRQLNNQSPIQTSLKMEDALYKGIENDHDFLKLNSILAYVELTLAKPTLESTLDSHALATTGLSPAEFIDPRRQSITPEQVRDRNRDCLNDVFDWLRKKGVERILKLIVNDNQDWQCSDETIEEFLEPWDVRYLDWNKRDLSISAIKQGKAAKLVELWLTWSGQNTALDGWSHPDYGLTKELPKLREVHIEVHSSVESIARMRKNLDIFKERIESQSEKSVDLEQQNKGQAKQTGKRTYGLKFDLPQNLSTGPYGPMKGDRGTRWEKVNERKWMDAIQNFRGKVIESYTMLRPGSKDRKSLDERPIKVALIDDGVNPSQLNPKGSVKGGWPLDGVTGHRVVSTYYNSAEGHGTTMANLIHTVCPFVHLYVAKLEKDPPERYGSVLKMAADAVEWAVAEKVDIISMSWTIRAAKQNGKDKENLTKQIHDAGAAGISLFCSSDDIGVHTHTDQLLPSPSIRLKRIGSCNGNGTKSDFVGETNIHYLFPGEQLPVMQEHLERKGSNREGDQGGEDKGSSASTALAAGLAALVLWCTVKSGGDKSEFLNDRMYDLFDALKVDQARASLVDVSGLMDDIIRQDETAHESVSIFVEKLRKLSAPKTVLKGVGF